MEFVTTPPYLLPESTQVPQGLPGTPKRTGAFGVNPEWPSHLTGFSFHTPIHHLGPEERSRRSSPAWAPDSSVRTVAESSLVTWEVLGRLSFAHLREEVAWAKWAAETS